MGRQASLGSGGTAAEALGGAPGLATGLRRGLGAAAELWTARAGGLARPKESARVRAKLHALAAALLASGEVAPESPA